MLKHHDVSEMKNSLEILKYQKKSKKAPTFQQILQITEAVTQTPQSTCSKKFKKIPMKKSVLVNFLVILHHG